MTKYFPSPPPNFEAFTLYADKGVFRQIVVDVGISHPFVPPIAPQSKPEVHAARGLWDTGATNSVITKSVASRLGLRPTSISRMTHAGGVSDVNAYIVNLYLPNRLMIHTVHVLEMADTDGFDILIGMDVIVLGDFAITNVGNVSTFSFRYPSIATIDYTGEAKRINSMSKQSGVVGRNELCPCGSGRKYKNCHGR